MQRDEIIFIYSRRHHWLASLGIFICGLMASLYFLLPGRLNDERIGFGVLFSLFALIYVFYLFDSITSFTALDVMGIQTRRAVFDQHAWGWGQVRKIDVHTADLLGLHNLFAGRTTFVRCTLIDGEEFMLVDRGMLNGNGMEAIAQRIITYWHRQYPMA